MFDLISEILQTLKHNKLRTALTGFAVAWGIFMLIVLLSMAKGVTNTFEKNMLGSSSMRISIWGGRTSKPYHGYKEGRRIKLVEKDIALLEDEHPDFIKEVSSVIYGGSTNISTNKTYVSTSYDGVFPSYFAIGDYTIEGRAINAKDMKEKAKVIILPEAYAKQLFPPEGKDAIGQRVSVGGVSFKVIGVYESNRERTVFIPFTTAKSLASSPEELGSLQVSLQNVKSEEDGNNAEAKVRETMAGTHNFDPDDTSAVWLFNRFTNALQGQKAMGILTMSVWILGLLTLLSGIVGISNIMFVSVRERTHEIGIRRAIGAKPRSILIQVIAESVAITTIFGYIGIVLGTALSQVLAYLLADQEILTNPQVDLRLAFEVTLVLIVAGALAGLFPALKALKVKPVEALRDE